jgi:hypothetical protein
MASEIDIANRALSKIGEARITSFDDDSKPSRAMKSAFDFVRDAEFRAHRWHFTKKRITLPALSDKPLFGWTNQFQLPSDYLQLIQVGQCDPGIDMRDYRFNSSTEWTIEGNVILTNYTAPLSIRYVARVTDPTRWDAAFNDAFACKLAVEVCEELTQSTTKKQSALQDYELAIKSAIRANAIELPPQYITDDSWILSRV